MVVAHFQLQPADLLLLNVNHSVKLQYSRPIAFDLLVLHCKLFVLQLQFFLHADGSLQLLLGSLESAAVLLDFGFHLGVNGHHQRHLLSAARPFYPFGLGDFQGRLHVLAELVVLSLLLVELLLEFGRPQFYFEASLRSPRGTSSRSSIDCRMLVCVVEALLVKPSFSTEEVSARERSDFLKVVDVELSIL